MRTIDWYFDFVSGYAYLQFERLDRLSRGASVRFKPVLLAALLDRFGHLGPAELPPKREHTYRHWVWLGARLAIPIRMPPSHPFNPLAALRLAIACGGAQPAIAMIFRFIWREGRDAGNAGDIAELAKRLGIADPAATLADDAVKAALRAHTDEAAARGVFGVPTAVVEGRLFWGLDATDMLIAQLENPDLFGVGEYRRVHDLPVGASRARRRS